MAEPVHLTPTSYVVLGFVAGLGPMTSYDMKRSVASSIGYFWSFPHSQLYAEPGRLVDAGLLEEQVEETGRKRRRYRITDLGRAALAEWLRQSVTEPTEIRDLGLLKLFFSAHGSDQDRLALARRQYEAHDDRRREYERLHEIVATEAGPWELATLDMGLRFERAAAAFWRELLE